MKFRASLVLIASMIKGWFENGQLEYEHPYHEGKEHGMIRCWYSSGQLWYEHPYHEGKRHGLERGWDTSGRLLYISYHFYGDEVTEEEYKKNEAIRKLAGI